MLCFILETLNHLGNVFSYLFDDYLQYCFGKMFSSYHGYMYMQGYNQFIC